MYTRTIGFGLAAVLAAGMGAFLTVAGPAYADGATLTVHNDTGEDVDVFIFTDDSETHKNGDGAQLKGGHLKNGEAGKLEVKVCHFAVILQNGNDVFHKEFHDCKITDIHLTNSDKRK
jgi:hypothetical protein